MTRAQPGAGATAERLRALGHDPVVEPVLAVEPISVSLDLIDIGALAFTSANAVRAFADLTTERGLPVFTVGEATAQAAGAAGFTGIQSANGAAEDLIRLIADAALDGMVLNPGAEEPARDFVALMAEHGLSARHVAVYRTVETSPEEPPQEIDAVLIHSPKAGRRVARMVEKPSTMAVYAISEEALAPLRHLPFRQFAAARFPNEVSLLSLLAT